MMTEKKLLKQIEKLRSKARQLEVEAKLSYEFAEDCRKKGDESLLDLAEQFEYKADDLMYEAEDLKYQADELEEQLDDLRDNVQIDDTPKVKPAPKRKVENKVEEEKWNNIPQRLKKVFESYLEMAQQGSLIGIYEVGNCFYYGVGVEQNIEESLKWYKLAAEGGHNAAVNQINEMFLRGESPEMFFVKPLPPKNISQPFFTPKKKSSTPKKSSYDGSFSDVDDELSALYNSEKYGYEENTLKFKDTYSDDTDDDD